MLEESVARLRGKMSVTSVVVALAVLPFLPAYLLVQGILLGLRWIFSATRNSPVTSVDVSAPTSGACGAEESTSDNGKPSSLPNSAGEIAILANAHDSKTQPEESIRKSKERKDAASSSDPPGKDVALVALQAPLADSCSVAPDGGVRTSEALDPVTCSSQVAEAETITQPAQHHELSPPAQPQGPADLPSSQGVYPQEEASMAQKEIPEQSKQGVSSRQAQEDGGTGAGSSRDTPAGDVSSISGKGSIQNEPRAGKADRAQATVAPPPATGSKLEATGSAAILARLR